MLALKDKHRGETAWIIGKGKSLLRLKRGDIGDGPVIAIYEALIPIEEAGFPNPIYSLQKDGGQNKKYPLTLSPECDSRDCENCMLIIRPAWATLLVHDLESRYCLEDYSPRYVFTLEEIGMDENQFSLACAIKIALYMGCDKLKLVSCDAHAIGDNSHACPLFHQEYYDWVFGLQKQILPKYLEGVNYSWITPSG